MAKAGRTRTSARTRKPRVNVLFEPEVHSRLVDYCDATGHKKSTFIALVVREYLDRHAPKAARPARRRAEASPRPPRTRR